MLDPLAAARDLLAEDPDPETRGELEALVRRAEAGDEAARRDLADRMSGPLQFGTAGLRGRVEAGLARMNRLAVMKATWGLGSHLLDEAARGGPDPRSLSIRPRGERLLAAARPAAYVSASVPIPKLASALQHDRMRASESTDTRNLLNLVWLWFRSPHLGRAARNDADF